MTIDKTEEDFVYDEMIRERANKSYPLTPEEAGMLFMIDLGPRVTEGINPDNARTILDSGVEKLRGIRRVINDGLRDKGVKLENLWQEVMVDRYSGSHAIKCAVNGEADCMFVTENIDVQSPDAADVKSFLKRHARMKGLLAELYKIDIMRRMAEVKKDPSFIAGEYEKLKALSGDLAASLDDFSQANDLSKEKHEVIKESAALLRDRLEKIKSIDENFYEQICTAYSDVVFNDYDLNIKDLTIKIHDLTQSK
jgi:hypothetical protein